jgi:hypothetical protein
MRRLRVDANFIQIDVFNFIGDLPAPCPPDMLRLAQAHRDRRLTEAAMAVALLVQDFIDVVGA